MNECCVCVVLVLGVGIHEHRMECRGEHLLDQTMSEDNNTAPVIITWYSTVVSCFMLV